MIIIIIIIIILIISTGVLIYKIINDVRFHFFHSDENGKTGTNYRLQDLTDVENVKLTHVDGYKNRSLNEYNLEFHFPPNNIKSSGWKNNTTNAGYQITGYTGNSFLISSDGGLTGISMSKNSNVLNATDGNDEVFRSNNFFIQTNSPLSLNDFTFGVVVEGLDLNHNVDYANFFSLGPQFSSDGMSGQNFNLLSLDLTNQNVFSREGILFSDLTDFFIKINSSVVLILIRHKNSSLFYDFFFSGQPKVSIEFKNIYLPQELNYIHFASNINSKFNQTCYYTVYEIIFIKEFLDASSYQDFVNILGKPYNIRYQTSFDTIYDFNLSDTNIWRCPPNQYINNPYNVNSIRYSKIKLTNQFLSSAQEPFMFFYDVNRNYILDYIDGVTNIQGVDIFFNNTKDLSPFLRFYFTDEQRNNIRWLFLNNGKDEFFNFQITSVTKITSNNFEQSNGYDIKFTNFYNLSEKFFDIYSCSSPSIFKLKSGEYFIGVI